MLDLWFSKLKPKGKEMLDEKELGKGTYYCCYLCRKLVKEFYWVEGIGNIAINSSLGTKEVQCQVCESCIENYNKKTKESRDEDLRDSLKILSLKYYWPEEKK